MKLCRRTGFLRLKSNSTFVFPTEKEYELIGRLRRSVLKARNNAKLPDFRLHDLRHTVATWLTESGIPLKSIGDLLGHSSIRTTEKYSHPEEAIKKSTDILGDFSRVLSISPTYQKWKDKG